VKLRDCRKKEMEKYIIRKLSVGVNETETWEKSCRLM
jgi:hypothetical protein